MDRWIELRVTPQEAIERLRSSEALADLQSGQMRRLEVPVGGSLEVQGTTVILFARLFGQFTGSLDIEFEPTERGCRFMLEPTLSRLLQRSDWLCMLAFPVVFLLPGLIALDQLPLQGFVVAMILAGEISLFWNAIRRRDVLYKTLVDVMWRAWSPVRVGDDHLGYRAFSTEPDVSRMQ